LDVPLVESSVVTYKDFTETSFDSDLENWVVKYPTTPEPGEWWNAFFFGHTSQEYWKKNPYGTVFRRIPQLKENDKIQVVREWVLYEYKVLKTVVVRPKDVNDTYVNFWEDWKEYITLMWCYPIWRIDKRMMIFAERI
jgi:LPXTG-site transpeptidase (sortase) family protein